MCPNVSSDYLWLAELQTVLTFYTFLFSKFPIINICYNQKKEKKGSWKRGGKIAPYSMGIPPIALCYSQKINQYLPSTFQRPNPATVAMEGNEGPGSTLKAYIYIIKIFFAWQINWSHMIPLLRLESNKAVCSTIESTNPFPLVWCLHQSSLRDTMAQTISGVPLGIEHVRNALQPRKKTAIPQSKH